MKVPPLPPASSGQAEDQAIPQQQAAPQQQVAARLQPCHPAQAATNPVAGIVQQFESNERDPLNGGY